QPQLTTVHGHGEHDLAFHLPAVDLAHPRTHLEPSVAALEARLDAHPVDRYRPDVLELDWAPQPDRHLEPEAVGYARIGRRGIWLQVAVVEQAHDVSLLLGFRLDGRLTADDEQVLGLEIRREVEAEWSEIAVVRAEQPTVQPHVGGEKRAADAQHDAAGVIRAWKLGSIPHRLPPLVRRQLARDLDRLPAAADVDRQALGFAFAERHPHGLPSGELAAARRALRERHEQGVAQRAYGPSAVEQNRTGCPTSVMNGPICLRSTSASTLPPKPAPMMRAP